MRRIQTNQNRLRCRQEHHQTTIVLDSIAFVWLAIALFCNSMSPVRSATIENGAYKDIVIEISDYVPLEKCGEFLFDLEVSS